MKEFSRVLILLALLAVPAMADTATDLSHEYINLLYELDDLWNELDDLDEMLGSHQVYLDDLDTAISLLGVEIAFGNLSLAEECAAWSQMAYLYRDYAEMQEAIDNIEGDIDDVSNSINNVTARMSEIEYLLTGL